MKNLSGFTLIEMMVTVAVLAIILGIGVPAFQSMIQDNRAATVTNDLIGALQLARSEAIKRRADVAVCPADSTASGCDDDAAWTGGWLAISGGTVLRVWDAAAADIVIGGPEGGITFGPDGRALAEDDEEDVFSVAFEGSDCARERTVNVSPTGRVTASKGDCP